MQYYLLDLLFVLVVVGATIALAKRALLEVGAIWVALVLSILAALNTFEPVAKFIVTTMFAPTDEWLYCYLWFASLMAIFALAMVMMLKGFFTILDGIRLGDTSEPPGRVEKSARWGASLVTAYTFAAFLLTGVHTLPATRDFGGFFAPELHSRRGPVLAVGPDYQLLTFTEYVSTPRSALTGSPWKLEGPLVETSLSGNRWSSFPIRYALWREATDIKLNDRLEPEDEYEEFDEELDDELQDGELEDDEFQNDELNDIDVKDGESAGAVVAYAI